MDEELASEIRATIVAFTARQLVLDLAVQELVRLQSETIRGRFASALREQVAALMQNHVEHMNPTADAAMSLSLASLLEAAGEPPARPRER